MAYDGLTKEERKSLSDDLGQIVAYFSSNLADARRERDAALKRVAAVEEILARYRRDGARTTDLAAA